MPIPSADRTPRWQSVLSGLEGALLSVWGTDSDDVWMVGADARDGLGPTVIHGTIAWERVDLRDVDPMGGHLWWVFGPGRESVWTVGEMGRVFRYDRAEGQWAKIETGTDATLYGVWGASEDELWAVGGYVYPRTGRPVIVRLTREGGSVVSELPKGVIESGTFFKVWGSAKDDVWVVGERGMLLHWNGVGWTRVELGGMPRLVTIHGQERDDVVIVGGTNQAVIYEGKGGVFRDRSPGPYPLLSGVSVGKEGEAVAVGMLGQVMARRGPDAEWTLWTDVPVMKDWHAVWRDPLGDLWVVGGNLLSAARFDEGTALRYGPPRGDIPGGALDNPGEVEVADDDVGDVHIEPDTSDAVAELEETEDAAREVQHVEDVEPDLVALEDVAQEDGDAGPVDGESLEEVSMDTEIDTTTDTGSEPDVSAPADFEIGRIEVGTGLFEPIEDGSVVDLIHGPQGGFHVEVFVRFDIASNVDPLATIVDYSVSVEGVVRGAYRSIAYPMARIGEGRYQSYLMMAIFCEDPPPGNCYVPSFDSSVYDGDPAELRIVLEPPGERWERNLVVTLRDTF